MGLLLSTTLQDGNVSEYWSILRYEFEGSSIRVSLTLHKTRTLKEAGAGASQIVPVLISAQEPPPTQSSTMQDAILCYCYREIKKLEQWQGAADVLEAL